MKETKINWKWRRMRLPERVETLELTDSYGKFKVDAFERGFGITVGNSLRRVLLSSLEGTAVTSIKITTNGGYVIPSEFETIPGVLEDVTEIVLNVKSIIVRSSDDRPHVLRIEKDQKGEVRASDIKLDAGVEIINQDLLIATLTDDVKFEMDLVIQNGRGYVPVAEMPMDENSASGMIPVDASYSPVMRVQYNVEPFHDGQKMNYESLLMQIWTDGSISPQWALVEAAKIMRKHLNPFVQEKSLGQAVFSRAAAPAETGIDPFVRDTIEKPISELDLSIRAKNSLDAAGIATVRDLVSCSEDQVSEFRNLGAQTLQEIKEKLKNLNLTLGMRIQN